MATHSSILARKSPGTGGSLVGCSPWGCEESDTTEQLNSDNRGSGTGMWTHLMEATIQPTTCSQAVSSGVECRVLAPGHHTGAGLEPALSPLPCPAPSVLTEHPPSPRYCTAVVLDPDLHHPAAWPYSPCFSPSSATGPQALGRIFIQIHIEFEYEYS